MSIYALSTSVLEGSSLSQAIRRIGELGFRQIEVAGSPTYLDEWVADPELTRRLLADSGIIARSMHSPSTAWDNGTPDEEVRQASIEVARICFGCAAALGVEYVVVHPNKPSVAFTTDEYDANWARSRDSLAALAAYAQEAGVKLALENLPSYGTPRPGTSIVAALHMIEGLGDHVGICLDAGHSNANGLDPATEAVEAGDRLLGLHIQDNDGRGKDQHLLPGLGTADWDALLAALDEMAFGGVRAFEVAKGEDEAATLVGLAQLRQLWEARPEKDRGG